MFFGVQKKGGKADRKRPRDKLTKKGKGKKQDENAEPAQDEDSASEEEEDDETVEPGTLEGILEVSHTTTFPPRPIPLFGWLHMTVLSESLSLLAAGGACAVEQRGRRAAGERQQAHRQRAH